MDISNIIREFYETEKVSSSKRFARFLHLKDVSKERDIILANMYARWLDEIIDSGKNPNKAKLLLNKQRGILEKKLKREYTKSHNTYTEIVDYLHKSYGQRVIDIYMKMIQGLEIDNQIIITGKPINENLLNERHLTQVLEPLKMLSLIAFDKELKYSPNFENLLITLINYDSLIDLKEDIESGLILFSSEDLEKENIQFKKGLSVPDNFQNFINKKKREILKELIYNSSSVEETNIPLFEREAFRLYFLSRPIKLMMHNCKIPKDLKYNINTV